MKMHPTCPERRRAPASMDVGTGKPFQVPSLMDVSYRSPVMHGGCARTLGDRSGRCGGDQRHSATAGPMAAQLAALVAYLETL